MQIVKTEHHLIYTAETGVPSYACLGVCKKVWWASDIHLHPLAVDAPSCPQCSGMLTTKIPDGHYTVITDKAGKVALNGAAIENLGMDLRGK